MREKRKNPAETNFRIALNTVVRTANVSVDFFRAGYCLGNITFRKRGGIWITPMWASLKTGGALKFRNPDEFFQALHKIRVKQNDKAK